MILCWKAYCKITCGKTYPPSPFLPTYLEVPFYRPRPTQFRWHGSMALSFARPFQRNYRYIVQTGTDQSGIWISHSRMQADQPKQIVMQFWAIFETTQWGGAHRLPNTPSPQSLSFPAHPLPLQSPDCMNALSKLHRDERIGKQSQIQSDARCARVMQWDPLNELSNCGTNRTCHVQTKLTHFTT